MKLHRQAPVIDAHNDSLRATMIGDPRYNPIKDGPPQPRRMWEKGFSGHWDFPRALEGGLTGQVTNILGPRPQRGPFMHTMLKAYQQAVADIEAAPHLAMIARNTAEIEQAHRDGKVALILGIEGAEGLEGDLDMIHFFHRLGVRLIGLTWMNKNL